MVTEEDIGSICVFTDAGTNNAYKVLVGLECTLVGFEDGEYAFVEFMPNPGLNQYYMHNYGHNFYFNRECCYCSWRLKRKE